MSNSLQYKITNDLINNNYECTICYDKIGKRSSIWYCSSCYIIIHLSCMKNWSLSLNNNNIPCPVCRRIIDKKSLNNYCFCGKIKNPRFNKYSIPHTCSNICNKNISCSHKCEEKCHPGKCPPCKHKQIITCYCEKKQYQTNCNKFSNGISCKKECGKLLDCKIHYCTDICHKESCKSCNIQIKTYCYCKKESKLISCTGNIINKNNGYYSCNNICGKLLSCGNHYCSMLCHNGDCNECDTDIHKLTCPCGKINLDSVLNKPRISCLDDFPTCNNTCGKLLPCGLHFCKDLCHTGDCSPCKESIIKKCRCGQTNQTVKCIDVNPIDNNIPIKEILCNTPCVSRKSCRRHKCNKECCPLYNLGSEYHSCDKICNKLLSCKNHKCKQNCHRGKCNPCIEASFDEVSCSCGKTIMYPPIPCGSSLPECLHMCSRNHNCDHPITHQCHYNDECPKCYALVTRQCGCGKKLITTKCHNQYPCCGDLCKKILPCGNHICLKPCHGGSCIDSKDGESCGLECGKKLLNCSHKCKQICHPNEDCLNLKCTEMVILRCPCGIHVKPGICGLGGIDNNLKDDDYIRLECNDLCSLNIMESQIFSRILSNNSNIVKYSESLLLSGKTCTKFINKIEGIFDEVITSKIKKKYQFPPMNSYYRRIIHQLAEVYNMKTESIGIEPNRKVIIYKIDSSFIPEETLSQKILKENNEKKKGNLLFYNLTSKIQAEHIHYALKAYEGQYNLYWINNDSAIVIFNDENKMKEASFYCSNSEWFKVAPIIENDVLNIFSRSNAC